MRRFFSNLAYVIGVLRRIGGVEPRACILCGFRGYFRAAGQPPRYDAECPKCGSRERHRLFGLLLQGAPDLGRGRVVHFAPERCLEPVLRRRADRYLTADKAMTGCDLSLDIEAIALPDSSVDVFVVNHVLEHVDDAKALREILRCLVPGGTALISVPVIEGWRRSYEDADIARSSARQRSLHFGHPDHRRIYGADVRDRIVHAGFELSEFTASGADTVRYRLTPGHTVFIARKPQRDLELPRQTRSE